MIYYGKVHDFRADEIVNLRYEKLKKHLNIMDFRPYCVICRQLIPINLNSSVLKIVKIINRLRFELEMKE